jgi:hypothetical protein
VQTLRRLEQQPVELRARTYGDRVLRRLPQADRNGSTDGARSDHCDIYHDADPSLATVSAEI